MAVVLASAGAVAAAVFAGSVVIFFFLFAVAVVFRDGVALVHFRNAVASAEVGAAVLTRPRHFPVIEADCLFERTQMPSLAGTEMSVCGPKADALKIIGDGVQRYRYCCTRLEDAPRIYTSFCTACT